MMSDRRIFTEVKQRFRIIAMQDGESMYPEW